jgi:hypothetical protein
MDVTELNDNMKCSELTKRKISVTPEPNIESNDVHNGSFESSQLQQNKRVKFTVNSDEIPLKSLSSGSYDMHYLTSDTIEEDHEANKQHLKDMIEQTSFLVSAQSIVVDKLNKSSNEIEKLSNELKLVQHNTNEIKHAQTQQFNLLSMIHNGYLNKMQSLSHNNSNEAIAATSAAAAASASALTPISNGIQSTNDMILQSTTHFDLAQQLDQIIENENIIGTDKKFDENSISCYGFALFNEKLAGNKETRHEITQYILDNNICVSYNVVTYLIKSYTNLNLNLNLSKDENISINDYYNNIHCMIYSNQTNNNNNIINNTLLKMNKLQHLILCVFEKDIDIKSSFLHLFDIFYYILPNIIKLKKINKNNVNVNVIVNDIKNKVIALVVKAIANSIAIANGIAAATTTRNKIRNAVTELKDMKISLQSDGTSWFYVPTSSGEGGKEEQEENDL